MSSRSTLTCALLAQVKWLVQHGLGGLLISVARRWAGVSRSSVGLGRLLAVLDSLRSALVWPLRSVPFSNQNRKSRLVFSLLRVATVSVDHRNTPEC